MGRNVPPPPLLSLSVETWEEMEEEEDGKVTWVKVEVGANPMWVTPPWSTPGEDAHELWKGKMGKHI